MDLLPEQITGLSVKVDALHKLVEQLNNKTSEILSEVKPASETHHYRSMTFSSSRHTYSSRLSDPSMEHKDVLVDGNFSDSDSHSGERMLTPEVQIQRLTAQLTAAYNRIAALEEQLLAQRIH